MMKRIFVIGGIAILGTLGYLVFRSSHGTNYVDESAPRNSHGTTYVDDSAPRIIQAVQRGDSESVRQIINADPAALMLKDSKGNSAAHWAILDDHAEIAIYLIEKGYPINPANSAECPLIMCCVSRYTPGSQTLMKYLIDHGANVNVLYEPEGWLPLNLAVNNGMEDKVRLLVKSGASLSAEDRSGLTPLELAKQRVEQYKDPNYNLPHRELNDPKVRQDAIDGWERMVKLILRLAEEVKKGQ